MNVEGILIHHTASRDTSGCDTQAIRRFHVLDRGWRDIGYHFVCERIGEEYEVLCGRPIHLDGAHCPGKNATHLGFALIGNFEDGDPPGEQLIVAAKHLAALCDAFGLETSSIEPHSAYRATACPGSQLDVGQLRELVESYRR